MPERSDGRDERDAEREVARAGPSPRPTEEDPEALRAAMARTRAELRDAWADVEFAVREQVDPWRRFQTHPLVFVGAAFAVGVMLGVLSRPE